MRAPSPSALRQVWRSAAAAARRTALRPVQRILLHLAQHTGAFGGETPQRLARCREWLFWEANRIGTSLPHLRFGQRFDPQGYPSGVLDWMRQRFDADIARLDDELADGRAFMLGDAVTVADFALCG